MGCDVFGIHVISPGLWMQVVCYRTLAAYTGQWQISIGD